MCNIQNVLITAADSKWSGCVKRLQDSASKFDQFNRFIAFNIEDLHDLYNLHPEIMKQPRGAGYWLWKPYIVLKVFDELCEEVVSSNFTKSFRLVYLDSGVEIIDKFCDVFRILDDNGVWFCQMIEDHTIKRWTKGDCLYKILESEGGLDHMSAVSDLRQLLAAIMGFSICPNQEKTDLSDITKTNRLLLQKFYSYSQDVQILTDIESVIPNHPEFYIFNEHRHDQSVLSVLVSLFYLKGLYKNVFYRDPTQRGYPGKLSEHNNATALQEYSCRFLYTNSNYPQICNHHRRRMNETEYCEWLQAGKPEPKVNKVEEIYNKIYMYLRYFYKKAISKLSSKKLS